MRRQADDLAVLQERDLERMRRDGERVAGEEVLALADADHQRAAEPSADDLPRALGTDHAESVRPFQPRQRALHRAEQVAVAALMKFMGDEMSDDLGVGLALEGVAERLEFAPEGGIIFDDAVMNDGDLAAMAADVRVSVAVVGGTVRGPSGMADAAVPRRGVDPERILQRANAPRRLSHDHALPVERGDAGAVIASILQPPQAGNQDRARLMPTGVSYDSAHLGMLRKGRRVVVVPVEETPLTQCSLVQVAGVVRADRGGVAYGRRRSN